MTCRAVAEASRSAAGDAARLPLLADARQGIAERMERAIAQAS
jgi:hypothetical protein